jgi:hypothetical protein
MAIDLAFVSVPGVGSNTWAITPSDDDAKDSDNLNHVLTTGALDAVTKGLPADITLRQSGVIPFYLRKQHSVADFQGSITLESGAPAIIHGTKAGGPVDLVGDAEARLLNPMKLPCGYIFYDLKGGAGTNVSMFGMRMKTNPSANDRVGFKYGFGSPWDNMNLVSFVQKRGLIDTHRTGIVLSITAPDGMGKQTVVQYGTLNPRFGAGDVGKTITVFDTTKGQNNGRKEITDFIDGATIKINNPGGVVDANPNCRWTITDDVMEIGRWSGLFDGCEFDGSLGDPILQYSGSRVSSVDVGLWLDDKFASIVEGQATLLTNVVDPGDNFLLAEHSGLKFYMCQKSLITNGDTVVKNIKLTQVGLPLFLGYQWGQTLGASGISLPSGANTQPLTEMSNVEMTDCGLDAFLGSSPLMYCVNNQGTIKINNNKIIQNIGSKDAKNFLVGLNIYNGSFNSGLGGGESTNYGKNVQTDASGPDPLDTVLQITGNEFDMDPVNVGEKSPFSHIFIQGLPKLNGDPRGLWMANAVIGNNILGGKVDIPVLITHQQNMLINYNTIEGRAEKQSMQIRSCVNVVPKNNSFLTSQQFDTLILNSANCGSINQLGTGGKVLDANGSGNVVQGSQLVTDETLVPPDEIETRSQGKRRHLA